MSTNTEINEIELKFEDLQKNFYQLKGEYDLMVNKKKEIVEKINKYEHDKEITKKAVELLNVVQIVSRDQIKDGFEKLVTFALRYIYNEGYSFQLEFGKRGNLQELNFNVKTPDFEEPANPLDTSGDGVLNIVSVALRAVLLEVSRPKIEGFLILDESFANLSKEFQPNASKFLKELNKKLNRQIIMISHLDYFLEHADNVIELK